jgi:hypothetical protein
MAVLLYQSVRIPNALAVATPAASPRSVEIPGCLALASAAFFWLAEEMAGFVVRRIHP